MLSERSLQILEKLIDNNRTPITSKTLALYLGVSERSVKTYIKEVSDFCKEQGMTLERKPGIGFVADFSENQIEQVKVGHCIIPDNLPIGLGMHAIIRVALPGLHLNFHLFGSEAVIDRGIDGLAHLRCI